MRPGLVQYRPPVRIKTPTCPVTCWRPAPDRRWPDKVQAYRCSESLAPGAKFCAKHEADRVRLS